MIAVAWDVDGTLVDSEPLHLLALQSVCRAQGVDLADFGPAPFIGVSISEVWRKLSPRFPNSLQGGTEEHRELAFRAAVNAHYQAGAHSLRAKAGAIDWVRRLAARGIRQCAVSSSERAIVEANLQAMGIRAAFEFLITLDEVERAKPDPEPYQRAVVKLGLPAAAVWAVEDSSSGLASARGAGLPTVLIADAPDGTMTWGKTATRVHTSLLELDDDWPPPVTTTTHGGKPMNEPAATPRHRRAAGSSR